MKNIAGRWVVGVAFDSAAMAAKFEEGISDRYLPGVEEALVAGNGQFFELEEGVTNTVSGHNTGNVLQIGNCEGSINISGRRVQ